MAVTLAVQTVYQPETNILYCSQIWVKSIHGVIMIKVNLVRLLQTVKRVHLFLNV